MDYEDWMDLWDAPFKQLVPAQDRFFMFKILRRAYFISPRLHRLNLDLSPTCWRWLSGQSLLQHFLDLLSYLPVLDRGVIINTITQAHFTLEPKLWFLGLMESMALAITEKNAFELFFYARKSITMHWNREPPYFSFLLETPEWNLPLYTVIPIKTERKSLIMYEKSGHHPLLLM